MDVDVDGDGDVDVSALVDDRASTSTSPSND